MLLQNRNIINYGISQVTKVRTGLLGLLGLYWQWVWVCLTVCLCLALPDAKVNNQSETTKCAMESGDANTGEWPPAFSPPFYWAEIRDCGALRPHSTGFKFHNLHFCCTNQKTKKNHGSFPKSLWAVLFVKWSVYLTEQFASLVPIEYHSNLLCLSASVLLWYKLLNLDWTL